jgi:hypothetical protein
MTRYSPARAFRSALSCAVAVVALQTDAMAQTVPEAPASDSAPAPADTIRLSDEQRDLILNRTTPDSAAIARGEMSGSERERAQIHGEVGVMVGTNGTRGMFGRADIPLGDRGGATIMFESSRFGYRR